MEPPRVEPPPPPPAPFDPSARPKAGGCPKPLVVGCIVVILIAGVALLGGFYYMARNAPKVLQWSLQQMETGLMAQLPQDVTPEEKERLRQAFADVRQGIRDGRIPPQKLQPLQMKMIEIARKGSSVTRKDIQDLTRSLEEVAGKERGVDVETPSSP